MIKKIGFLLFFFSTILSSQNWEKSKTTVIDKQNRLEWQDIKDMHEYEAKWSMAETYCRALHINGQRDWRLPTQQELLELAYSKKGKSKFRHLENRVFWSSEEDNSDTVNALSVYIGNGHLSSNDKCEENAAICVRNHLKK